jgi:hypothetical protein
MTIQWSTTLRDALNETWETAIGVSAKVMLYTGAQPANVAAATTGTKLAEFDLGSDWAANSSGGSKSLNSLPISTSGLMAGTLGYYRIFASDGTTCHEQGSITASGGGGDMTVDNTSVSLSQTVKITGFTQIAPGA